MEEIIRGQPLISAPGELYAPDFEDFYFSRADGLAESRYVFLEGGGVQENWKERAFFTIAETGFGTGLNFLATWNAWQQDRDRPDTLHYFSVEKHPIHPTQLDVVYENWPELKGFAQQLLEQYPPLLTGMHRLIFDSGRVQLTLCFMDVESALPEWVAEVDCWYLDGFAPSRNPKMWSESVMREISRLSKPGARLTTFTAASKVRKQLQAVGFQVSKRKGFGKKREMLTAVLPQASQKAENLLPWFVLPKPVAESSAKTATVIGAGIAGCQVAHALAQRGWQVNVLEQHSRFASEASGNLAGVISPKMTAEPGWGERFYRQSFLGVLRQLTRLQHEDLDCGWNPCGVLQLNHNEREVRRWQRLKGRHLDDAFINLLDAQQASQQAGIELDIGASYFPGGGWVEPRRFCEALLRHGNIHLYCDSRVDGIKRTGLGWQCELSGKSLPETQVLIICSGKGLGNFAETNWLPFIPVRGQTSRVRATPDTQMLRTVLGHEGYLTPALTTKHGVEHVFGATFERHKMQVSLSAEADQVNHGQLAAHLPELAEQFIDVKSAHAAIRVTTPDRYPYVGAVPDKAAYESGYRDLRHGKPVSTYPEAEYLPGLFVLAGLGSRGLTTSYGCAELLTCLITQEPLPLEKSLYYQLHPARFLLKQLKTT